jgi:hypothetical protein
MNRTTRLLCAVLVSAIPALAHHSLSAEFDMSKTVTISGSVNRVEWSHPHVELWLDVRDPSTNRPAVFQFQLGPPCLLQKLGWQKTTLSPGTIVTVTANPALQRKDRYNAKSIVLARGKLLDGGQNWVMCTPEELRNLR